MKSRTAFITLLLLFAGLTVSVGAQNLPPSVAKGVLIDTDQRVATASDKKRISCPKANEQTAVLLSIGQSNGGNHADQAFQSAYGRKVANFYKGKCFEASSPLAGTTGWWGESWTRLGNLLVENGVFKKVVIVPAAIGGSAVASWQEGGKNNTMLLEDLKMLHASGLKITHVLWHQGESDSKTTTEAYLASFRSLVETLRKAGVDAPIFVCVTSSGSPKVLDNPVTQAQKMLPDPKLGIFPGVDTDLLLEKADRNRTGHFSASGQEKFAQAWLEILRKYKAEAK